jgi:hypothetical protein
MLLLLPFQKSTRPPTKFIRHISQLHVASTARHEHYFILKRLEPTTQSQYPRLEIREFQRRLALSLRHRQPSIPAGDRKVSSAKKKNLKKITLLPSSLIATQETSGKLRISFFKYTCQKENE